jgi:hypothetical protein
LVGYEYEGFFGVLIMRDRPILQPCSAVRIEKTNARIRIMIDGAPLACVEIAVELEELGAH